MFGALAMIADAHLPSRPMMASNLCLLLPCALLAPSPSTAPSATRHPTCGPWWSATSTTRPCMVRCSFVAPSPMAPTRQHWRTLCLCSWPPPSPHLHRVACCLGNQLCPLLHTCPRHHACCCHLRKMTACLCSPYMPGGRRGAAARVLRLWLARGLHWRLDDW